jgi:hypothetical protein
MDKVLPDPEALKYVEDLKIISFIKESARNRYRDDRLSIKDASNKIREIVEEYLISQGINPKIPPVPLLSEAFVQELENESPKATTEKLKRAIIQYIEEHSEEDPEFYERFSDRLKKVLEEYKENWELLAQEFLKLRDQIKIGRENEETFGFDPKIEMPFFGLLKNMIFGNEIPLEKLEDDQINLLVHLTQDFLEIIKREIQMVDFWDSYEKQKRLKGFLASHILRFSSRQSSPKEDDVVKEDHGTYGTKKQVDLFSKRNEIAQRLLELAYHIYGPKNGN